MKNLQIYCLSYRENQNLKAALSASPRYIHIQRRLASTYSSKFWYFQEALSYTLDE